LDSDWNKRTFAPKIFSFSAASYFVHILIVNKTKNNSRGGFVLCFIV